MKINSKTSRVLYIVYWGAFEQLGQSLVVPTVQKLSQTDTKITLVTFEKPQDLVESNKIVLLQKEFIKHHIDWFPLRYHKSPKIPATIFDIVQGVAKSMLRHLATEKYDIVHARTFVGGLIGMTVAPLIGAKFVYHNEGFYPDEQVDGGVWAENSRPHKVAKYLENKMYQRADGIIALSQRAKKIIENIPEVSRKQTPIVVVPSCVDLDRFYLSEDKIHFPKNELNFVYIGSIGNRYILDKIGTFIATIRKTFPDKTFKLQIFSKADKELIKSMLISGGLADESWSLEAIEYREMPLRLQKYQAGLFFLTQGISEHGCSPTKIGEYWASGLPVITTPNVSDTDEIVRRERVGVVITEQSEKAYIQAFQDLEVLLEDEDTPRRCRAAAEKYYALVPSCEKQYELYQKLLNRG